MWMWWTFLFCATRGLLLEFLAGLTLFELGGALVALAPVLVFLAYFPFMVARDVVKSLLRARGTRW